MANGKFAEWLTEDGLLRLSAWARDGLTDEQIAANIGIAPKTLYRWKDSHSPICQALKKGKEVVDIQVENALLKRALGYDYEEVTVEADGRGKPIKVKKVTKHVPSDVAAMMIWLKNRKRGVWMDKPTEDNENALSKLDRMIEGINGAAKL